MTEFRMVTGFDEVWRSARHPRRTPPKLLKPIRPREARARLERLVRGAPEAMVKMTGRTYDGRQLKAHLNYITRNGTLDLEDDQGWRLSGRSEVAELAADWTVQAELDRFRRADAPLSHGFVLSMPAKTDPEALQSAARTFAAEAFGERFEHVHVLHTDTAHPHLHLTVRSCGVEGERLNPMHQDLDAWRQSFAQALRDCGVEAEATPRRARGVTRRPERTAVRKLIERAAAGAAPAHTIREALREAALAAFEGDAKLRPWEEAMAARHAKIRQTYLSQAALLSRSQSQADQRLAREIEDFVRDMPPADSRRLALARMLREHERLVRSEPGKELDRSR